MYVTINAWVKPQSAGSIHLETSNEFSDPGPAMYEWLHPDGPMSSGGHNQCSTIGLGELLGCFLARRHLWPCIGSHICRKVQF